ncbi:MAG: biopolymer transporter ExbD [Alphaproteobacteria bacterium]|nr:biopolymer transporter ExbD [Alphaproteobacteria bacterium]
MLEFDRAPRKPLEVSLIPLIDISMFLLIFFMVAGAVQKFEILQIDPPVAQSGKLVDEGHLVILLGKRDELIIGEDIIPLEQTREFLTPLLAKNPNKVITVKADAAADAGRVIDVMDAIKAAGGRQLSIVTQSKAVAHVE